MHPESDLAKVVRVAVLETIANLGESPERLAYTIDSAAAAVGLHRNTLRDAVSRGELPAVKRCGKWLITRSALVRWLSDS